MSSENTYDCPNCGQAKLAPTANRSLKCPNCGSEYTPPSGNVVDNIFARAELQQKDRFTHRAEGVADVKAKEKEESQQRLNAMWADEHKRQTQLAEQLSERHRQEAQMMRGILIAGAVVAVVLVIILIAVALK